MSITCDVIADVETFPNVFLAGFLPVDGTEGRIFEISERRNEAGALFSYMSAVKRMAGFNNFGFDWPVLDYFMTLLSHSPNVTAAQIYAKAAGIIDSPDRFAHVIWKPSIPQLDLYMIHHFDNRAKATSLKTLEFNMRSPVVADLPFPVGVPLAPWQIDVLIEYLKTDLFNTLKFYDISKPMIAFRDELGPEWTNYNDTKIGKQYFIRALNAAGIETRNADGSKKQTPRREGVPLSTVILPWIKFRRPELVAMLEAVKSYTVRQPQFKMVLDHFAGVKGKKTTLAIVDLDGFKIDLGLGGIHGSVTRQRITGTNILDLDVGGYYPSLAIVNRFYPAHLTERFCDVFADLKRQRTVLDKKSTKSGTLKLAQNGVFGDSGNVYSEFLDPAYLLATTINGQLLLCKLSEDLLDCHTGVRLVQVNTDGVTITYPDAARSAIERVYIDWQYGTGLDLEAALYRGMFIRDVNNYIAVDFNDKRKRKGAYDYEMVSGSIGGQVAWNKNFSKLVVPKAAEAEIVDGICHQDFIRNHSDPWDFLLRSKVGKGSRLELADGSPLGRIVRYYISVTGQSLVKFMPPLPGKTGMRTMGVHAEGQASAIGGRGAYSCSICGKSFSTKSAFNIHNDDEHAWKITECNVFNGEMPDNLDYRYYFQETEKLLL